MERRLCMRSKKDFEVGDFVFYQFLADDYVKARILELRERNALIEIGFSGKKSEDVKTEQMTVEYHYLIPVLEYQKLENKGNVIQ